MPDPIHATASGGLRRAPDERRAQILRAARELCLAHGMAAVRMEEIAARAHVSKGTLYNHFDSREDLLLAMVEERLRTNTEIVERAVGREPLPARALERMLDGLVEMIGLQVEHEQLLYQALGMVSAAPALEERLRMAMRGFYELWAASTRETLAACRDAGIFGADTDVEALTAGLLAMVSGFIFRAAFDPEAVDPATLRSSFAALLAVHGHTPSLAPPGDS